MEPFPVAQVVPPDRGISLVGFPLGAADTRISFLWASARARGMALFIVGTLLSGLINYLFGILMARDAFLGAGGYGAFTALMSALSIDSVLTPAVALVATKHVATVAEAGVDGRLRRLVHQTAGWVLSLGLLLTILFALASPGITRFLHLSSVTPVLLIALFPPLNMLSAVLSGALQGLHLFSAASAVLFLTAVTRIAVAVPLVAFWNGGVSSALFATLGAAAVGASLAAMRLRRELRAPRGKPLAPLPALSVPEFSRDLGIVSLGLGGLIFLSATDVVLARHFLSAEHAGVYSAFSTLGRIAYFASLPITLVTFPVLTQRALRNVAVRRPLAASGLGVLSICALTVVLYAVYPAQILSETVGPSYLTGAPLLWRVGAFFGLLAVAHWLMYAGIAFGWRLVAVLPLFSAGIQAILLSVYARTLPSFVGVSLLSGAALVAALGISMVWLSRTIGTSVSSTAIPLREGDGNVSV